MGQQRIYSFGHVQSQASGYPIIKAQQIDCENGWLWDLYGAVLLERHDPSETSEKLTQTYITKKMLISDHYLEKLIGAPLIKVPPSNKYPGLSAPKFEIL